MRLSAVALGALITAGSVSAPSFQTDVAAAASDEKTVPRGSCYVEYLGGVYLDGPCTEGALNNGFSVSRPGATEPLAFVALYSIAILNWELSAVAASDDGACVGNHLGKVCFWGEGENRPREIPATVVPTKEDRCYVQVSDDVVFEGTCVVQTDRAGSVWLSHPGDFGGTIAYVTTEDGNYGLATIVDKTNASVIRKGRCWLNAYMSGAIRSAICVGVHEDGPIPELANKGDGTDAPQCSTEFVGAWIAWDQRDEKAMPPLPKAPCVLVDHRGIAFVCAEDIGAVDAAMSSLTAKLCQKISSPHH